ncbi:hypothetical protein Tco_1469153, partial [Tanacetum coccineum]
MKGNVSLSRSGKAKRTTEISQSSGPIHLVADETVYKEWEEIMERVATTASSLEAEQDSGNINRTQSMATLDESFPQGTDSGSGPRTLIYFQKSEGSEVFHHIIDFLTTSHISTLEKGDMEITATIHGKVKVVFEASIRRHLKLEDSDGISTFPTLEIFEQLALMGYGRHEHDFKEPDFKFIAPEEDYTAEPDISTTNVPDSTAGAEVSTASPEVKTTAKSLVYIRRSLAKRKDKGKAIMKEAEPVQKKTKLQIEVHEEANTFNAEEWNNIQAQIEVDEELAH